MRKNQMEKNQLLTAVPQSLYNAHYRDSSGKTIFKNPILCSQFLRDYVNIPMLKDVRPEDIEDVTERYVHMFTEERDSDIVKKVKLKNNSFYLVSLIEHKSDVDYNTIMQVFRYITFIWEDYEKEQEKKKALSILMLIEKLRNAADYEAFEKEVDKDYLEKATENSPQYLLKLMSQVIEVFLAKLNVPREEVVAFTEQIEERKMGELFKHFEGWDVQAIRKEAKEEARKEVKEKVKKEIEKEVKEKVKKEIEKENKSATAKRMLAAGKYALEEIADISGVSLDEVKWLKAENA